MPEATISQLSLSPAQTTTTTEQVFNALYSAVISLQMPPGMKVSEAEIAKQLDISRQPVRDAFFRLSKLGFLSIRPQRATLVTKVSAQAVLDAAFVRSALEAECAAIVCQNRSAEDLEKIRVQVARQYEALNSENAGDFHAEDDAFHQLLCNIAGHGHVWAIIQEHKAHMDRIRYLTLSMTRRREVISEHQAIVDAIENGDVSRTRDLVHAHIAAVKIALETIRRERPEYFEIAD